ncbi:MAG: Ger(x)C family spore germination protein [Clostridia bacterium]|nr:Ger(x)C family spore germination protein [Clostridia bacterium]
MGKRLVVLLVLLSFVLGLSGCWSIRETEELAIIGAIGIDKVKVDGKEKYRFVAQVIRPDGMGLNQGSGGGGGGSGNSKPVWVIATLGDNLDDAHRNFNTRSERKMFLAHNKVIILSEQVAKESLQEIIDLLQRERELRLRSWVMVTKGEAMSALTAQPQLETLLHEEYESLVDDTRSLVSKAYVMDLKDFFVALADPGRDPITGKIEIIPSKEMQSGGHGGGGEGMSPKTSIRLTGAAVFRKDKLAGWLGDKETKGYLYLSGKAQQGVIPLRMPTHGGEWGDLDVSFEMTRSSSKIVPVIEGGKLKVKIEIEAEGDLGEHEGKLPIARPQDLEVINKEAAREIKRMARQTLTKVQKEYKADILGIGDKIHKKYPKTWAAIEDRWLELYPDVEVEIKVKAHVRRTGMIGESLKIR